MKNLTTVILLLFFYMSFTLFWSLFSSIIIFFRVFVVHYLASLLISFGVFKIFS